MKKSTINKQSILNKAREKNPLVHHLTNTVVMNFSANGLLSFGGSPIMAKSEREVIDIASHADAVLINIGTLTKEDLSAMILAGEAAHEHNVPVVLDPVGVAATPFRSESVERILQHLKVTVIKGNAGEIAHLGQVSWEVKGVDSIGDGNTGDIALKVAEQYDTAVVVTGEVDSIAVGNQLIQNDKGHIYSTKAVGGGCLLGSIIAACSATDDPLLDQLLTAVSFYGSAAEYAASQPHVHGPGTFLPVFLDALAMDFDQFGKEVLTNEDIT